MNMLDVRVLRGRLQVDYLRRCCLNLPLTIRRKTPASVLKIILAFRDRVRKTQSVSFLLSTFAWLEKFRATSRPLTTRPWFDTSNAKARGKISLSVSKPGLTFRQEELDPVIVLPPNSNSTPYPLKPGIKRAYCLEVDSDC